jgi:uncharacterized protein (UPF0335 family)
LRAYVERIQRLEAEIKALNDDKSEVYSEAKSVGFNVAILRIVIKRLKMDDGDRREQDTLVDLYERVIAGQSMAMASGYAERDASAAEEARINLIRMQARDLGRMDARAGNRDHADQYPNGTDGCADYELGHQDIELEREARIKNRANSATGLGQAAARAYKLQPNPENDRASNPYEPDSDLAKLWDAAWEYEVGQRHDTTQPTGAADGSRVSPEPRRRPSRRKKAA